MKIHLSDADRERFGCPEILDSSHPIGYRDALALEAATGEKALDVLRAMAPDREELGGGKVKYSMTLKSLGLNVWLGLYRAGIHVPYAELDFDFGPFLFTEEIVDEGKEAGSPTSEPATSSRSRRSGRSTPSKT